jgi:hypothetical protein
MKRNQDFTPPVARRSPRNSSSQQQHMENIGSSHNTTPTINAVMNQLEQANARITQLEQQLQQANQQIEQQVNGNNMMVEHEPGQPNFPVMGNMVTMRTYLANNANNPRITTQQRSEAIFHVRLADAMGETPLPPAAQSLLSINMAKTAAAIAVGPAHSAYLQSSFECQHLGLTPPAPPAYRPVNERGRGRQRGRGKGARKQH